MTVVNDTLKVNQLVEIKTDGMLYRGTYPSRIEEITGNVLYLAVPIRSGELVPLRTGETIRVSYVDKDNAYSFVTRVLGRKIDPIPVLIVERPQTITRIQRRNFVRIEASLPIYFQLLEEETGEIGEGRTVDISGGGVLFTTRAGWIRANHLLRVRVDLPQLEPVVCIARVIRVGQNRISGVVYNQVACKFEDLREGQRDTIIKFIFERQRELIKKGLLWGREARDEEN